MTLDTNEILANHSEFALIIQEILENETVQKMKLYIHHYNTTCFDHCIHVAYASYWIAKKRRLDYVSAARAGMLHDLFLYDWHEKQPDTKGFHAFTHAKTAFGNANKLFHLNPIEKDAILKHMWPVTFSFPRYQESYIITLADKYAALRESFDAYKRNSRLQKLYRYSYVFLTMVILKFI